MLKIVLDKINIYVCVFVMVYPALLLQALRVGRRAQGQTRRTFGPGPSRIRSFAYHDACDMYRQVPALGCDICKEVQACISERRVHSSV